ncbi:MAG TPA: DNA-processing protein DprA [Methylococcaceae bacterium]|nr:DNA-processing protein DprA [Methylococcaceae bacterium]
MAVNEDFEHRPHPDYVRAVGFGAGSKGFPIDVEDRCYWLALWRAPGVGAATFRTILERVGNPRALFFDSPGARRALGLREATLAYLRNPDWAGVERDENWLAGEHRHLLTLHDPRYPPLLAQIADPPPLLFVHGDAEYLSRPQLAMVGSRNPTPLGAQTAFDFARSLAAAGLTVTSGLASGIDAASHRGALETGATVAVMGTGPDRVYPARHRELAHHIAANGALVSEWPTGTPVLANNFPRRNRLISGLSLGTLVVEAAAQSGSLITARLALEQGREVLAIPGSIHNPLARGCNALIRQGAKLVETIEDVLEEIAPLLPSVPVPCALDGLSSRSASLDAEHLEILKLVAYEPTSVDTLAVASGETAESVASMLLILELEGYVASLPGGRYQRLK